MDNLAATQQISTIDKTMLTSSPNATIMGAPVKCPVCGTENAPSEQYCGNCGFLLASTPETEVAVASGNEARLTDASGEREYFLKEGENTVGRENTDVLLNDGTVSRRHAIITLEGGKCSVQDLGSTNGTFVAGQQIRGEEKAELADGGEVKFGSAVLRLKLPEASETPSAEPVTEVNDVTEAPTSEAQASEPNSNTWDIPAAAAPQAPVETADQQIEGPTPVASLVSTTDPSKVFPVLEGLNTIGRRSDNSIVITGDSYISGAHAELVADERGFWLLDVGSTNGTVLNGARITPNSRMALDTGDDIVFGQTAVKFQLVEHEAVAESADE